MRPVAVILAGGASRRMGADKAEARLHGRRLVDIVHDRLAGQGADVILSGRRGYDLGAVLIEDDPRFPAGPACGIFSAAAWLRAHRPDTDGFLTAPVDGPFFPDDFIERLSGGPPQVAAGPERLHPTFAWWPVAATINAAARYPGDVSLSLHALVEHLGATPVFWADDAYFSNINTQADLAAASARLQPD